MHTHDIKVLCDVYCKWSKEPPVYRLFVNEELFTERTWIWQNAYLEEELIVRAAPGQYPIEYQLITSSGAGLKVRNIRVVHGPARIWKDNILEIWHESP
jgi:hypothetical protein